MDVVAYARAVRGRVIGAVDAHAGPAAERRLAGHLDEVRGFPRRLADTTSQVGTGATDELEAAVEDLRRRVGREHQCAPPSGQGSGHKVADQRREVITLRFVDDLSLQEITEVLQIPLGTVKSRLHLAIKQLRESPETRKFFEL